MNIVSPIFYMIDLFLAFFDSKFFIQHSFSIDFCIMYNKKVIEMFIG